jgi:hypothetical protein
MKLIFNEFDIGFAGQELTDENGHSYAVVDVKFGKNHPLERGAAYLSRWGRDEYRRQWKDGLARLFRPGTMNSCLVVSVQPIEYTGAIECFELHVVRNMVAVRYVIHAPILSGSTEIIDPMKIFDRIAPRDESENEVSEWWVSFHALHDCFERLAARA